MANCCVKVRPSIPIMSFQGLVGPEFQCGVWLARSGGTARSCRPHCFNAISGLTSDGARKQRLWTDRLYEHPAHGVQTADVRIPNKVRSIWVSGTD